jgi:hypothetical protein
MVFPPYRANTWLPICVMMGRDQIHRLTGFAGFQKKTAPPEGSQPFSASRAARTELLVGFW